MKFVKLDKVRQKVAKFIHKTLKKTTATCRSCGRAATSSHRPRRRRCHRGRSTAACAVVAAAVLVARAGLVLLLIAVVQGDELRLNGRTTAATLVVREELCLPGLNAALARDCGY